MNIISIKKMPFQNICIKRDMYHLLIFFFIKYSFLLKKMEGEIFDKSI